MLAVDFQRRYELTTRLIKQAHGRGSDRPPDIWRLPAKMVPRRQLLSPEGILPAGAAPGSYDGGGSAANQGIHGIDQTLWFMGPVQSVRARINIFNHDIETEDALRGTGYLCVRRVGHHSDNDNRLRRPRARA